MWDELYINSMINSKQNNDNGIRFLLDTELCLKFKEKIRSAGYSNMSEFLRSKIREFVDEGKTVKNENN